MARRMIASAPTTPDRSPRSAFAVVQLGVRETIRLQRHTVPVQDLIHFPVLNSVDKATIKGAIPHEEPPVQVQDCPRGAPTCASSALPESDHYYLRSSELWARWVIDIGVGEHRSSG